MGGDAGCAAVQLFQQRPSWSVTSCWFLEMSPDGSFYAAEILANPTRSRVSSALESELMNIYTAQHSVCGGAGRN